MDLLYQIYRCIASLFDELFHFPPEARPNLSHISAIQRENIYMAENIGFYVQKSRRIADSPGAASPAPGSRRAPTAARAYNGTEPEF